VTPYIAVIGGGRASRRDEDLAEAVGRHLAAAGAVVVCGGLGGVMAAACRGAQRGGGLTIGILPGLDRGDANPWVEIAIPTGLGEGRNILVVRAAGAVVAVGGEYGTLAEIALALRAGIAVVGLGTWGLIRPDGLPDDRLTAANDPSEAVSCALEAAAKRAPG
jgi:uncharacterized protein (TIGR00725 family)